MNPFSYTETLSNDSYIPHWNCIHYLFFSIESFQKNTSICSTLCFSCCKYCLRYTTPAAYKASFYIETCIVKCWCEIRDTENWRCQASRFSHVMTDESYRQFYLITNILLTMWFKSATVNKNSVEIPTFKNTFLLNIISVKNQSPMKLTGIMECRLW